MLKKVEYLPADELGIPNELRFKLIALLDKIKSGEIKCRTLDNFERRVAPSDVLDMSYGCRCIAGHLRDEHWGRESTKPLYYPYAWTTREYTSDDVACAIETFLWTGTPVWPR